MITGTDLNFFKKNATKLVEDTVRTNGRVRISTTDGNAVMLSEKDYFDLVNLRGQAERQKNEGRLIEF